MRQTRLPEILYNSIHLKHLNLATQPGPSWIRNLTLEEIVSTIKSFPTGKAAGPDGFCSEFFDKFCGLLAPLIVRMIINSKRIASHTKANEAAILSLDAQKVFDQVEWPYMFGSLQKFCFGETLISWVKLIYARPVCSILSNTLKLGRVKPLLVYLQMM